MWKLLFYSSYICHAIHLLAVDILDEVVLMILCAIQMLSCHEHHYLLSSSSSSRLTQPYHQCLLDLCMSCVRILSGSAIFVSLLMCVTGLFGYIVCYRALHYTVVNLLLSMSVFNYCAPLTTSIGSVYTVYSLVVHIASAFVVMSRLGADLDSHAFGACHSASLVPRFRRKWNVDNRNVIDFIKEIFFLQLFVMFVIHILSQLISLDFTSTILPVALFTLIFRQFITFVRHLMAYCVLICC